MHVQMVIVLGWIVCLSMCVDVCVVIPACSYELWLVLTLIVGMLASTWMLSTERNWSGVAESHFG